MSRPKKSQDATTAPGAKAGLHSKHSDSDYLQMGDFLQSGWRVATALLLPSLLGIWLDRQFETDNIFTVAGVLIGVVLSKIAVIKYVNQRFGSNSGGRNV